MKKTYKDARRWLRQYKLFENELKSRLDYAEDFKKVLVHPLTEEENTLKRIYTAIITRMENQCRFLKHRLEEIEEVINTLPAEERTVIYHRYIIGVSWLDMPEYIMYEQRTCQTFEMRALNKIVKMDIDWEGKKSER